MVHTIDTGLHTVYIYMGSFVLVASSLWLPLRVTYLISFAMYYYPYELERQRTPRVAPSANRHTVRYEGTG